MQQIPPKILLRYYSIHRTTSDTPPGFSLSNYLQDTFYVVDDEGVPSEIDDLALLLYWCQWDSTWFWAWVAGAFYPKSRVRTRLLTTLDNFKRFIAFNMIKQHRHFYALVSKLGERIITQRLGNQLLEECRLKKKQFWASNKGL